MKYLPFVVIAVAGIVAIAAIAYACIKNNRKKVVQGNEDETTTLRKHVHELLNGSKKKPIRIMSTSVDAGFAAAAKWYATPEEAVEFVLSYMNNIFSEWSVLQLDDSYHLQSSCSVKLFDNTVAIEYKYVEGWNEFRKLMDAELDKLVPHEENKTYRDYINDRNKRNYEDAQNATAQ